MFHHYNHYPMDRQMYHLPPQLSSYLWNLGALIGGVPLGVGQLQLSIPRPTYTQYGVWGHYGYPASMYPGMSLQYPASMYPGMSLQHPRQLP